MALHRDIHWIGRQWAVTGFGMQAVDQRHGGHYDIEIERLWDEELIAWLGEQSWFNADDFNKGLAIARRRHPEPPRVEEPHAEPEPVFEPESEVAAAPEPILLPEPIVAATPPVAAEVVVEPSPDVVEISDLEPPPAERAEPAKPEAPEDLLNKWFERYGLDKTAPSKRSEELPVESPLPSPIAGMPAKAEPIAKPRLAMPVDEPPPAPMIQMPITTRAKFVRPWRVPVHAIQSYRL